MVKPDEQLLHDLWCTDRDVFDKKIVEEPMELALGYMHFLDGKITREELAKEVADVIVQIEKIYYRVPGIKKLAMKELGKVVLNLEEEVYYNPNAHIETFHKDS